MAIVRTFVPFQVSVEIAVRVPESREPERWELASLLLSDSRLGKNVWIRRDLQEQLENLSDTFSTDATPNRGRQEKVLKALI
jgi:hypothetical protein